MEKSFDMRWFLKKELLAIIFVCSVAWSASELLNPVLPIYFQSLSLDVQTIGLLFSIMTVGIAISEFFWGWVVDRTDIRIAIFMGTVLFGVIVITLSYTSTLPWLAIIFFAYGFCRSPIFIINRWYVGVYAPEAMIAFAMAFVSAVIHAVTSLASFFSGFLAVAMGYRQLMWLCAGLAASGGLMIMIFGKNLDFQQHKKTAEAEGPQAELPDSVKKNAKIAAIVFGGIGVLYFIGIGINGTYLSLFGTDFVGIPTALVGTLFGVRGIVNTIVTIPIGRLADKYSRWMFMLIGLVITTIGMVSIAFAGNYAMLIVSSLLLAVGSGFYFPSATALLSQSVPVRWMGTAMGIYGLGEDIGWMIGPALGGFLWASVNEQTPFIVGGLVTFLAIPVVLSAKPFISQHHKEREVQAQALLD